MCGLYGIYSSKKNLNEYELKQSVNTIHHRGPDHTGIWINDNKDVGLAHNRLSIIDLTSKANQPMVSDCKNYIIIFNGEIYNYKKLRNEIEKQGLNFKTNSDTEVLLNSHILWGQKCNEKLNGMYAYAIFDKKNRKFFISRDIAGEKPLYYYHKDNTFIFSSEIKPIIKNLFVEKKINYDVLKEYLAKGFVSNSKTILENIKKLETASEIIFDINNHKISINKYWKINKQKRNIEKYSYKDHIENVEKLINESVKDQLVSDVPVGILLSGGVDSSLITASASKFLTEVNTFNVRFKNYKNYDESHNAKIISKYFGTKHNEIYADEIEPEIMFDLSKQFDEPLTDSSIIPTYLVCKTIKKHCKVALGGDGGDELFGGYKKYQNAVLVKKWSSYLPKFFKNKIGSFSKNYLPLGLKGKNWIETLDQDFDKNEIITSYLFDEITINKILKKNFGNFEKQIVHREFSFISNMLKKDFENYLPYDILVKVDRASMINSLEVRAPLLNKKLIEYVFYHVPDNLKVDASNKKILLKELCKKMLPNNFPVNKKMGFQIPLNEWLIKGKWRDFFLDILLDKDSMFKKKQIEKLFYNHKRSYFDNSERIFCLVNLELWKRHYNII